MTPRSTVFACGRDVRLVLSVNHSGRFCATAIAGGRCPFVRPSVRPERQPLRKVSLAAVYREAASRRDAGMTSHGSPSGMTCASSPARSCLSTMSTREDSDQPRLSSIPGYFGSSSEQ
jgi:hypothetical protein